MYNLGSTLSRLAHLPGSLLTSLADAVLPSEKSHSDFNAYCEAKGGKLVQGEDGQMHCQILEGHPAITPDDHSQMVSAMGLSDSSGARDYSDFAKSIREGLSQ